MITICLATGNVNKLKEIKELYKNLSIRWKTLADFPELPAVVEDGKTFEENALKKAREVHKKTGLITIADDSGLEVDYLKGAPGVYSARFSGENSTDKKNNKKLREVLKNVPYEKRTARFRCVATLAGDSIEEVRNGKIEGHIILTPRGESGFGYDPIFVPDGYDETFAELGNEVKNKISHRAMAFKAMKDVLINLILNYISVNL